MEPVTPKTPWKPKPVQLAILSVILFATSLGLHTAPKTGLVSLLAGFAIISLIFALETKPKS